MNLQVVYLYLDKIQLNVKEIILMKLHTINELNKQYLLIQYTNNHKYRQLI